ncbi:daunorubicin resistance protein DrrC [Streptomyces sp. ERV7]|uniref:ATP-binding cassette domain-containing protein n=1 Tax=Streptomyces sp. ERV7 TaxID=1322334 RepID=UPI0007F4FD1F|nr:excinuclease ABC subunit UvrA [Streptomyces sp. ERV7]OAR22024.1 daunorubicin resistance protein DrrC [Streptomyces sp. ERV7]
MNQEIVIEGAREHNLQGVSLRIPKNKITVFTGVSGSGKSSLVFSTIAVEAQRQLNETFTTFVRNRLPRYEKPDADRIDHLSTAVVVDQKPIGANARSTVGTSTDIASVIRLLFSRAGVPSAGMATAYSFNTPEGACPTCAGLGRTVQPDLDTFFDTAKSLNQGALLFPMFNVGGVQWNLFTRTGRFDLDKPLKRYAQRDWQRLLHGEAGSTSASDEGLLPRFERLYLSRDISTLSPRTRKAVEEYTIQGTCPTCRGERLSEAALKTRIDGHGIADYMTMEVTELVDVLGKIHHPLGTPLAAQAAAGLRRLDDIGLGYLSLGRETSTLSGGEAQRLKMVRFLGSALTGMTYIFDEPSTGLHPRDVGRMNTLLRELRDRGNTVLVVEHDRDVIAAADHIVDMGPGAGTHGGRIVYQGTPKSLRKAGTRTGRQLRRTPELKQAPRTPTGRLTVADAALHNLKNITVDIPTGVLTVFTGVAGSGKSTLVTEVFTAQHPEAVVIGQGGIGISSRATPLSHLGVMDAVRTAFAKAGGVDAGYFSFNSRGACPVCHGKGEITADMAFMDPVTTLCENCGGTRYAPDVLTHTLDGKNIVEVLALTAEEATDYFTDRTITRKINLLNEVGLGYLTLGQPLSTLSGGERQRLKLAGELHQTGGVYVLDEPTTGLHMSDIQTLLALLDRMVDAGNTVLVIEHDLDVIEHADWIIDLGPDGGRHGGQIIFQGTPADLLTTKRSFTAEHLRHDLGLPKRSHA